MENLILNNSKMKIKNILLIAFIISFVSCANKESNENPNGIIQIENQEKKFEFGVWITSKKEKTTDAYRAEFKKYNESIAVDEISLPRESII